jgi:hypothetical protein
MMPFTVAALLADSEEMSTAEIENTIDRNRLGSRVGGAMVALFDPRRSGVFPILIGR